MINNYQFSVLLTVSDEVLLLRKENMGEEEKLEEKAGF